MWQFLVLHKKVLLRRLEQMSFQLRSKGKYGLAEECKEVNLYELHS